MSVYARRLLPANQTASHKSCVYAGELGVAVIAPSSPAMRSLVWTAGGCLLACLVWSAVGLLVEHWCAIDMSDDDEDGGGRSSEVPGSGAPA